MSEVKELSKLEQYKTKVTQDPWRLKLYELQERLKVEEDKRFELVSNLDVKAEAELPEEEQNERKKKFGDDLARLNANIKVLKESTNEHRLNKTMSSFFEWHPQKGMNRRQARKFRQLRSQGKIKRNE